jgi:hypothetical protein
MTKKYDNFMRDLEELCKKHEVILAAHYRGSCVQVYDANDKTIYEAEVYEDCTDD